jgi:hypothetical protein
MNCILDGYYKNIWQEVTFPSTFTRQILTPLSVTVSSYNKHVMPKYWVATASNTGSEKSKCSSPVSGYNKQVMFEHKSDGGKVKKWSLA